MKYLIFLLFVCLSLSIQTSAQNPQGFKNNRLNALLEPISQTEAPMRITPTTVTYYEKDKVIVGNIYKNCSVLKDTENETILRCPFENQYWEKAFIFYKFYNKKGDKNDLFFSRICLVGKEFEMTKDKNFDIEKEGGGYGSFASTAPDCPTK